MKLSGVLHNILTVVNDIPSKRGVRLNPSDPSLRTGLNLYCKNYEMWRRRRRRRRSSVMHFSYLGMKIDICRAPAGALQISLGREMLENIAKCLGRLRILALGSLGFNVHTICACQCHFCTQTVYWLSDRQIHLYTPAFLSCYMCVALTALIPMILSLYVTYYTFYRMDGQHWCVHPAMDTRKWWRYYCNMEQMWTCRRKWV